MNVCCVLICLSLSLFDDLGGHPQKYEDKDDLKMRRLCSTFSLQFEHDECNLFV